jgi:hypothetical protein
MGATDTLITPIADAYQRLTRTSDTTLTLDRDCVAVMFAAATTPPPSPTNGLPIVAGAQAPHVFLAASMIEPAEATAFAEATGNRPVPHSIVLSEWLSEGERHLDAAYYSDAH